MKLKVLDDKYQVIRLKPDEKLPLEFVSGEFFSITKTEEELSIVVKSGIEIQNNRIEDNWRIMQIVGTLDFSLIGILSKISAILADNKIAIFVISTYNTDYILVKEEKLKQAIEVLKENGYEI